MKDKRIYLDYAATTPLDPKVLKAMLPYLEGEYGNPSSIHSFGQETRAAIEKAREKVAEFLNCSPSEVVFTGSATEANNLAILGLVKFLEKENKPIHLITTPIEHHAVLEPFKFLEKKGIEVTYLPVNKEGIIEPSQVGEAIKENTVLVSVMYANNEIGTVQPIREISKIVKEKGNKTFFHVDAVQAINYLDCNVKKLGVDLLTLSGHKIYGPKGIGALYIKEGTPVESITYGGGHERNLRPGTENVANIVGLAAALGQIKRAKAKKLVRLRNKLIKGILKSIPDVKLNGSFEKRLPNNVNISFSGAEGESIVLALDQEGIAVSTGSACSSKGLEPSHVLMALGYPQEEADSSIRISLGRYTTEQDISKILKVLPQVIKKLRTISGYSRK